MSPLRIGLAAALILSPGTSLAAGKKSRAQPPDIASVLSEDDYPSPALRNMEQGKVAIRLDIDDKGGVAGCRVTRSSGSAALDETTCRLFRERARFVPARDKAGRAAKDSWSTTITWRITDDAMSPQVDAATEAWVKCLYEAVRPLVAGPLTREEIVQKAYAACPADEQRMLAVSGKPGLPPLTSEKARARFMPGLLQIIDEARGGVRL
jgi:TonB family protein